MNWMAGMVGFAIILTVLAANLAGWRMNKLQKQIDDLKRELEELKEKMK